MIKITRQEAFDHVVRHAKAQAAVAAKLSFDYDVPVATCQYRGPNGTKCFVGALIPDKEYHCSMENQGVMILNERFELFNPELVPLLARLQNVHDGAKYLVDKEGNIDSSRLLKLWHGDFLNVAAQFDLDTSVLDGFLD